MGSIWHRLADRFPVGSGLAPPPLREAPATGFGCLAAPGQARGRPRSSLDEARGSAPNMTGDRRPPYLGGSGLAESIRGEREPLEGEVTLDRQASVDHDPAANDSVRIGGRAVAHPDRGQVDRK